MNRMPSEAKQEHLQWRRDKILELSSKGVSEREIVRLKSRLQQQAEWLDQHHKHREDAIRGRLAEKDQQINVLLRKDALNTDSISALSDKLAFVMKEIGTLKKNSHF